VIPMLRKAVWDLRGITAWFALGIALYTLALILYFPAVRNSLSEIRSMLEANKALMQAFGVTDIGTFSGFLGSYVLNMMWPLAAGAFGVTAGTAIVAKEIQSGTVEFWLSMPAGRFELLGAKLIALTIAALFVVGATVVAIVMVAFLLAICGVSSFLSAISNERGRAAGLAAGLLVASYLAWAIAGMNGGWSWLKNVSVFAAYDPQRALESGAPSMLPLAILFALAAVTGAAALLWFRRRDAIA
jgi:ABC-2 type transport system permease protein